MFGRRLPRESAQVRVVPLPPAAVHVERSVDPWRQLNHFEVTARRAQEIALRFVPVDSGKLSRHAPCARRTKEP